MKNSSRIQKNGSKKALPAQSTNQESRAGNRAARAKKSLFNFQGSPDHPSFGPSLLLHRTRNGEELRKTLDGRLIFAHGEEEGATEERLLKYFFAYEITYVDACGFLAGSGKKRSPEEFLGLHGITAKSQIARDAQMKTGEPAKLTLKCQNSGCLLAEVEFTAAEFSRIQEALADTTQFPSLAKTLSAFIRDAILKEANRQLFKGDALSNLEDTMNESVGCIQMLADRCAELQPERTDNLGGNIAVGVNLIGEFVSRRLKHAWEMAHNYAAGRAA